MNTIRCWYLNKHMPVQVFAEQRSDSAWYLPELDKLVDGSDLFRTTTGVLKALRRRIDEEIQRRTEDRIKPHKDAKPTKYKHLWLIVGGNSENEDEE